MEGVGIPIFMFHWLNAVGVDFMALAMSLEHGIRIFASSPGLLNEIPSQFPLPPTFREGVGGAKRLQLDILL